MKKLSGRLALAVTALAVAVLCLFRLFVIALCVGIAGVMLALALALFRHGSSRLEDTAAQAEKSLGVSEEEEHHG